MKQLLGLIISQKKQNSPLQHHSPLQILLLLEKNPPLSSHKIFIVFSPLFTKN